MKCLYLVVRSLDPTGKGADTMDEPMEAGTQRLRAHVRRTTSSRPTNDNRQTSYTEIRTVPGKETVTSTLRQQRARSPSGTGRAQFQTHANGQRAVDRNVQATTNTTVAPTN